MKPKLRLMWQSPRGTLPFFGDFHIEQYNYITGARDGRGRTLHLQEMATVFRLLSTHVTAEYPYACIYHLFYAGIGHVKYIYAYEYRYTYS